MKGRSGQGFPGAGGGHPPPAVPVPVRPGTSPPSVTLSVPAAGPPGMGNAGQRSVPGWVFLPPLVVLLRPRGSSDTVLLSCRPLHPPHHAPPAARRPHSTRGCAPQPPRTNCLRPHWVPGTPTPGDEQGAGPYASCTRITCQPVLHPAPPALSGVTATLQQPQRGAEKPDASPLHVPLHLGCPNHPPT